VPWCDILLKSSIQQGGKIESASEEGMVGGCEKDKTDYNKIPNSNTTNSNSLTLRELEAMTEMFELPLCFTMGAFKYPSPPMDNPNCIRKEGLRLWTNRSDQAVKYLPRLRAVVAARRAFRV
jgi:hypothetical protein